MKEEGDATHQARMILLTVTDISRKGCHDQYFHKVQRQLVACNIGPAIVSGMLPQYLKNNK